MSAARVGLICVLGVLATPLLGHSQPAPQERSADDWCSVLWVGQPLERACAAWALGHLKDGAAVEDLSMALSDQEPLVRLYAAWALGCTGTGAIGAAPALEFSQHDEDERVRTMAQQALAAVQGQGEMPPMAAPGDGGVQAAPQVPAVPAPPQPATPPPYAAPADLAGCEEVLRRALERGYSVGLIGDMDMQFNPNIPSNGISLTADALGRHAQLLAAGRSSTVSEVVGFLAGLGVRLSSTGQAITVEGLLPDLQAYVDWSMVHPEDPRSELGRFLASGPALELPTTAPRLSAETLISPLAALLLAADVLVGVPVPPPLHGGSGALPGEASETMLALIPALGAGLALPRAAVGQYQARERIRGLITSIEPVAKLTGSTPEALQRLKAILTIYDATNALWIAYSISSAERSGSYVSGARITQFQAMGEPIKIAGDGPEHGKMVVAEVGGPRRDSSEWLRLTHVPIGWRGSLHFSGTPDFKLEIAYPGGSTASVFQVVREDDLWLTVHATERDNAQDGRAWLNLYAWIAPMDAAKLFERHELYLSMAGVDLAQVRQVVEDDIVPQMPFDLRLPIVVSPPEKPDLTIFRAEAQGLRGGDGWAVRASVTVENRGDGRAVFYGEPLATFQYRTTDWQSLTTITQEEPVPPHGLEAPVWTQWQRLTEKPSAARVILDEKQVVDEVREDNNVLEFPITWLDQEEPAEQEEEPAEEPEPAVQPASQPNIQNGRAYESSGVHFGNGANGWMETEAQVNGMSVAGRFYIRDSRPSACEVIGARSIVVYGKFAGNIVEVSPTYAEDRRALEAGDKESIDVGRFAGEGVWTGQKAVRDGSGWSTQVVSGRVGVTGTVFQSRDAVGVSGRAVFDYAGEVALGWTATESRWHQRVELLRDAMGDDFSMEHVPWTTPDWAAQ